jgi:Prolyl oligopeptidase family
MPCIHGESDNDVHITQAEEMYTALRERGVTAELVRYPREGHGFHEPKHLLDQRRRTIEWMDRFLQSRDHKGGVTAGPRQPLPYGRGSVPVQEIPSPKTYQRARIVSIWPVIGFMYHFCVVHPRTRTKSGALSVRIR